MDFELMFSLVGVFSMLGWLVLLLSPWMPTWSDRIAGLVIPVALAIFYVAIAVLLPTEQGGFGNFAEIEVLFAQQSALMAGWVHFLAFDLLIGAWICRKARAEDIRFWFVVPCLPVTFLFGPAGFLLFTTIRGGHMMRHKQTQNVA